MAEQPLLFFPKPTSASSDLRRARGAPVKTPTAAEQKARLDEKFRRIAQSFQDVQASVQGMEPEQVIVLETIGPSVAALQKAAARVPGLEWLAEMELAETEPVAGFCDAKRPDKKLSCRLYAVMSNQQAMTQLIGLWSRWNADPHIRARAGFGPFKEVFIHLKDVRRWGVEDRLAEMRVVEFWEEGLRYERGNIRFEVELWCRAHEVNRERAFENLRQLIISAGGQLISQTSISAIHYHGVLAELPALAVRETIQNILDKSYSQLLRCEDVMFFRPLAQSAFPAHALDDEFTPVQTVAASRTLPKGEPVIALLDGLPLEHHEMLDGCLRIDDEDDFASRYEARQQQHGTAMASIIVHGDLSSLSKASLPQPVYVRPILIPYEDLNKNVGEQTPKDRLLVDIIHRAVLRIKGTPSAPGAAPAVKVVNLSIGNSWQPFDRDLSPFARLLDWLAWEYKILFVVSAGNQSQSIDLPFETADISGVADEEVLAKTLEAIRCDQVRRRPFSPAEAVNVLTIGALHADDSRVAGTDRRVDLLKGVRFPSPICTVASGFNRSVKPDVLFPGGRQLYLQSPMMQPPPRFSIADSPKAPGLRVAAPGEMPMELGRTVHSRGTSNATALAAHASGLAHDRLMSLRSNPGGDRLTDDCIAVVLKALLVHGASWGEAGKLLDCVFGSTVTDWREMQRLKSKFLGYGEADPSLALSSTDQRVVMLGWDSLGCGKAHVYHVPLPPSLSGKKLKRRLTVSLAWMSPINPRHKDYRKAFLWFSLDNDVLAVDKKDLDFDSSRRGTMQHQIYEGDKARAFSEGDMLKVKVNCAEEAGKLMDKIPYALAITLEIAESVDVKIYEEVKTRIRPKIEIAPEVS